MLKEKVLAELEQNKGKPVSGQILAEKNGVSRNAVWKCISALKQEGYRIDSVRKKGYVLSAENDILSVPGIRSFLSEGYAQTEICVFDTVDSTNNEAKRMLASGHEGRALLVSDRQSDGRGRKGKSFASPSGGMYLSAVLPAQLPAGDANRITLMAAVAVLRCLKKYTGQDIRLKWINDLFLRQKKIGGILTEAILDPEEGRITDVVIGIGLNLATDALPASLRGRAAALSIRCSRNELAAAIYREMQELDPCHPEDFMEEYRAASAVLGREVLYEGERVWALEIGDQGALLIRRSDGREEWIRSGGIRLL